MRILADFHHQGLFYSLHLLLERRLGFELYRPIGEEWYKEGYWMVYNHPTTVQQYLGLHNGIIGDKFKHTSPLNAYHQYSLFNQTFEIKDDIYYIEDTTCDVVHKGIQLDTFKQMKFDIILSSIPEHIPRYNKLLSNFQPHAKHVFQVGNNWTHLPGVENIMASTRPFSTNANAIFYHQEFNLDDFYYIASSINNTMNSYVHFMKRPEYARSVLRELGWNGKLYGAGGDEPLTTKQVAQQMQNSTFTWHYKPGGDGYGHVIHSTVACGRPPVIWGSQYRNCLAEELFEHGKTCIDAEKFSNQTDLVNYIKTCAHPDKHLEMCSTAANRFKERVNFEEEGRLLKTFFENLR